MDRSVTGECGDDGVAEPAAWREVDRVLRRLAARRAALDLEEAEWLRRAQLAEVHRHLGLASLIEYLERVLGYAPHTARERLRVAEALDGLPATRAALGEGRVPWSAVRELTRVATDATEEAWLAATTGRTVRDVEDAVRGRRPGDTPDTPPAADARVHVVRFELDASTLALWVATRRALEESTGHAVSDNDLVGALCRGYLAHAGPAETDVDANQPPHQIAVTTCAQCGRAWQDAAGQAIEISATELEQASCDAVHVGRVDGAAPERATRSIPPATRRMVLRRDRGRCVVPGCRNSRHVDVHHLVPRAAGGGHEPALLATLCSAHHRTVHRGELQIEGDASVGLTFSHGDGTPYGQGRNASLGARAAPHPPADDDATRKALLQLGFPAPIATGAVARGRARVGPNAPLRALVIAALRACREPTAPAPSERARPPTAPGSA